MTAVLAQARTATPEEQLLIDAKHSAISLITRVRTDHIDTVWTHLAALPRQRVHAILVVLAAMVPIDTDPDVLLEWLNDPDTEQQRVARRATARARRIREQDAADLMTECHTGGPEVTG